MVIGTLLQTSKLQANQRAEVCIQAQQKHQKHNTHSFAQCIYSSWKTRFICPNSLHRVFFCLQYHTTTPHGKQTFKTRRLKPKIGLSTFLSHSISTSSPQGTVLSPVLFLLSRVLRHSLPRQSVQQRARFLLSSCETAQTHKGAKTLATSEPSGSMNTSVVKTRGTIGLPRP